MPFDIIHYQKYSVAFTYAKDLYPKKFTLALLKNNLNVHYQGLVKQGNGISADKKESVNYDLKKNDF